MTRRLEWQSTKRGDIVGLSKGRAIAQLWSEGIIALDETLEVQTLEKGAWRKLETGAADAYSKLRQADENHMSLLVESDRITAVSGCGCVFELAPRGKWELLHRPKTKDFEKLCEAVLVREPTRDRLVAFRGGTFGEVNRTGRLKCQRTMFFEKGAWRLSKQETKDPNRIDWMTPRMFFDGKRVVRLYGDGVGVLEKDEWKTRKPDALEPDAWLAEGYVPLHDSRSRKTVLLVTGHAPGPGEKSAFVGSMPGEGWTGDEIHVLAFDDFMPLGNAPTAPGTTLWDPKARCLLAESRGKVWSLDLTEFLA